ncbi:MAG: BamA/TamA family outer membrane protein [Kofleriaceae bacterium]|nr:BamA/TamA family outer membrane protein [Kofleriaceae bacterium]
MVALASFAAEVNADGGPGSAGARSEANAERESIAEERLPVIGFRMRGKTKTTERTARYLSRIDLGDDIGPSDLPRLHQAFLSSELFETVSVSLERAAGGYLVVATVKDKHSWIIAPTLYVLAGARALGVGFAENNLRGQNQKLLLYGQIGDRDSMLFGTYLDPSVAGTPLIYRYDFYSYRRVVREFANPRDAPTNNDVARESTTTYLGGGLLIGWRFAWWLTTDLRLRGANVSFTNAHAPDAPDQPLTPPEKNGWDVSAQWRLTLDARHYRYGVRWGAFLQLVGDTTIPGLDDYDYSIATLRAYYSWRLFAEHQLELRSILGVGRELPFHEEQSLGGVGDLRGYAQDRFRGDLRSLARAEYSVPLAKWRTFAFRAVAFWDSGYAGLFRPRTDPRRDYLPGHVAGTGWWRNDVGAGFRIYVKAVVLPLLGLDIAYGIEARAPEVYFQLGLTDF